MDVIIIITHTHTFYFFVNKSKRKGKITEVFMVGQGDPLRMYFIKRHHDKNGTSISWCSAKF